MKPMGGWERQVVRKKKKKPNSVPNNITRVEQKSLYIYQEETAT